MPRSTEEDPEHTRAFIAAYERAVAVQFQTAPQDLTGPIAEAAARGWPDVEYLLNYAAFCHAATSATARTSNITGAADNMRRLADRLGDPVVDAMTVAIEARVRRVVMRDDDDADLDRDEEHLAQAVATLDEADPGSPFRGMAYFVCAVAYAQSAAVQLEIDMYDRVEAADRHLSDAYRQLRTITAREVAQNRVSAFLDLACEQAELGNREQAARIARSALDRPLVRSVGASDEGIERQRAEMRVLGALARRPDPGAPTTGDRSSHPVVDALDLLATAIRADDAGDVEAAADAAEAAILNFDAEMIQTLRGFALSIAARRPPVSPQVADYMRTVVDDRWHARQRLIGAARARIHAEAVRIENARLTERAFSDELTGLGNRHALTRHLTTLARSTTREVVAVLLVDVDEFKAINDVFGHRVGDEVLRRLGALLSERVRAGDAVVRMGGDEFVVIALGADITQARISAERLVQLTAQAPWSQVADDLRVGISVGISAGTASDVHRLIDEADRGLYAAKHSGRGRVATTSDHLTPDTSHRDQAPIRRSSHPAGHHP